MAHPIDPSRFVETLRPALRQAAAIASALEGRVWNEPKAGEPRPAKAALTIADTAAQEALLVPLLERFPEVGLEAEEDTASAARFSHDGPCRVVIDPIDGTYHSYLGQRGPYAVMAGLACEGRYEAAVVALPREGLFFDAVRGGGAFASEADHEPSAAAAGDGGRVILVSHELPEPVSARLAERGWSVRPASGGAVAVAPLVPGVRAGLRVAPGPSVSVRGRIGLLIAREAGAAIVTAGGAPFPDDLDTPCASVVVASDDETRHDLAWALGEGTLVQKFS